MNILNIRNIALFLGIFFFLPAYAQQATTATNTANARIKIAVLSTSDFFPDRAVQQRMGLPDGLAARIIENLATSKRFQVLERTALRKIINEQQFGEANKETFLDRALDAATDNIADTSGFSVAVTTSAADSNDLIKNYQNLGSTMGTDFLVFAVLEKAVKSSKTIAVPYSESNRTFTNNKVDARLRLRIINAKSGVIAGAASFRTQVSESLLIGQESQQDSFSTFDHLGKLAANKILDITFPAKIVSYDPLVINRGRNDSYTVGSTFKVVREGKEILDTSGVSLGKVTSPVGTIRLTNVQETLAVVEIVEGNIQAGDLLEITASSANSHAKQAAPRTQHKNGKQKGKITLAVGKIRLNNSGNNTALSNEYRIHVTNDLLVKLTNSNRFDVLERQEIDQVFDEKSLAALTSGQQIQSKLSELTEADYLIFTSVNDFQIRTETKKVAYVDAVQTRYVGIINATLRIVDSHTGKLLAADKVRINKRLQVKSQAINNTVYANLIDDFTTTLVSRIMLRLYPIKIIGAMSATDFYINRGADGGLKTGAIYNVMREGTEMIDPDTGISFGKVEQKVGQVKVTSIETSRSIVHLISGSGAQSGDVLRFAKQEVKKAPKPTIRRPSF
ncbi:MAG: hypothetical protein methR_P1793 [Methyloprofundus sp.]|nr:MAG: hypothetical protein methR_P1793 [Methyloprofundus sp.]